MIVNRFKLNTACNIFARVMKHPVELKALEALLNSVSGPELESLNAEFLMRILISKLLIGHQGSLVWGKSKRLHLCRWWEYSMMHRRDKVSRLHLQTVHRSVIDVVHLQMVFVRHYQTAINKGAIEIMKGTSG